MYAIRQNTRIGGKLEAFTAKMQLGLAQKTLEILQFGPLFPGNRRLICSGRRLVHACRDFSCPARARFIRYSYTMSYVHFIAAKTLRGWLFFRGRMAA
ncbi:MAG TPA: hypothetical protein VGI40_18960 [Pirellulaceae bacterium]